MLCKLTTLANGGDKQNSWWMGGTDLHHEGSWVWMSGAPWGYENWNDGEPNQNGNEDCTAFDSQAGYKVRITNYFIRFIFYDIISVDGP